MNYTGTTSRATKYEPDAFADYGLEIKLEDRPQVLRILSLLQNGPKILDAEIRVQRPIMFALEDADIIEIESTSRGLLLHMTKRAERFLENVAQTKVSRFEILAGFVVLANRESATQRILEWAEYGYRVTAEDPEVAGDKTLWAGLGNRSGLHSFAGELLREKWNKGGARLTKKLEALPAGTVVTVYRYDNITRDKGKWVAFKRITL